MFVHMCICTKIILLHIICAYGHTQVYYYTYTFIYPDIDECSNGTDTCTQTCTDTHGSFTCGCNTGYELDTDGFTCNSKHLLVYHYDY